MRGEESAQRQGVPLPARDPEERRLEDAQGAAARRLEELRRRERGGAASSADVLAAREALAAAWAELDAHQASRAPVADLADLAPFVEGF